KYMKKFQPSGIRFSKHGITVIAVFVVIGVAAVLFAAAYTASKRLLVAELEQASLQGNASVVDDAAASGGKAIRFLQAAAPPPAPTPPPPTPPPGGFDFA